LFQSSELIVDLIDEQLSFGNSQRKKPVQQPQQLFWVNSKSQQPDLKLPQPSSANQLKFEFHEISCEVESADLTNYSISSLVCGQDS